MRGARLRLWENIALYNQGRQNRAIARSRMGGSPRLYGKHSYFKLRAPPISLTPRFNTLLILPLQPPSSNWV